MIKTVNPHKETILTQFGGKNFFNKIVKLQNKSKNEIYISTEHSIN